MVTTIQEKEEKVVITKQEYLALFDIYKKLEPLFASKKKKAVSLKSLCGIWRGVEISDEDIEAAKKSLFKHSL